MRTVIELFKIIKENREVGATFTTNDCITWTKKPRNTISKTLAQLIKLKIIVNTTLPPTPAIYKLICEHLIPPEPDQPASIDRVLISEEIRLKVFSRFQFHCACCMADEGLQIHHRDKDRSNNSMDNLIPLCYVCHTKIHKKWRMADG